MPPFFPLAHTNFGPFAVMKFIPAGPRSLLAGIGKVSYWTLVQQDKRVGYRSTLVTFSSSLVTVRYSIRMNDQWRVCFVWKNGDAIPLADSV
jgi:hypothetical protein